MQPALLTIFNTEKLLPTTRISVDPLLTRPLSRWFTPLSSLCQLSGKRAVSKPSSVRFVRFPRLRHCLLRQSFFVRAFHETYVRSNSLCSVQLDDLPTSQGFKQGWAWNSFLRASKLESETFCEVSKLETRETGGGIDFNLQVERFARRI